MSKQYRKGEFGIFPALQLKGLDPYKQTVMAWLIFHTNTEGQCFPSIDTLVEETGISKRKLVDVLQELHRMGLIEKTIRNSKAGRKSTLYTVYKKRPSAPRASTPSAGDATGTQVHEAQRNNTHKPKPIKDEFDLYADSMWQPLMSLGRKHGKVVFSKKKDYARFFREIGDIKIVEKTMSYLMSDANFKAEYGWKNAPFSVSKLREDWNKAQDKVNPASKEPQPINSGRF